MLFLNQLQTHLLETIHPNQTRFVVGNNTLDNVFCVQVAMEWAIKCEELLILFLFDFEKSFDHINYYFLFVALQTLSFSEN
jgi:hypothetical protein